MRLVYCLSLVFFTSACAIFEDQGAADKSTQSSSPVQDLAQVPDLSPAEWYELGEATPENLLVEPHLALRGLNAEQVSSLSARGSYLTNSLAACGVCHGTQGTRAETLGSASLSGGRVIADEFGEVYAPNITPDKETGIGAWTLDEVIQALRASIGKEERPLSLAVHREYRWMSDADALAIAVYLFSSPAVRHQIPRRELGYFQRRSWGMFAKHAPVVGYVPSLPDKQATAYYGGYLVQNVAACGRCHSPAGTDFFDEQQLAGSERPQSDALAENGTSKVLSIPPGAPDIRGKGGLKGWSQHDFLNYLATGKSARSRANNAGSSATLCPWPWYRSISNKDQQAMYQYLIGLEAED